LHQRVKAQIEELEHPSDSLEFMQHMLEQTKRVEEFKKGLQKLSKVIGVCALGLFVYAMVLYMRDHVSMAVLANWVE